MLWNVVSFRSWSVKKAVGDFQFGVSTLMFLSWSQYFKLLPFSVLIRLLDDSKLTSFI